ncbi:MAG TPA: F0F1 ATP synthase subunit B [Tepidisphaeraceae bacterium]|nr:F0F1 ATP synthase subunit B [Tepidisphaeraceae bacterium]
MLKRILTIVTMAMMTALPALGQAEEHNPPGFQPQLIPAAGGWDQAIATAIWTIVIFVIMLIILYPTAWKAVLKGLKAREERIRKDIADAENARAKAETTLRDYNAKLAAAEKQVQEMIAKATSQGEAIATQIRNQAQKDAEEARSRTQREIESATRQAVADFKNRAAEVSTEIAEKIIRRNLSVEDQRDLVNRSLEQLQTVGQK